LKQGRRPQISDGKKYQPVPERPEAFARGKRYQNLLETKKSISAELQPPAKSTPRLPVAGKIEALCGFIALTLFVRLGGTQLTEQRSPNVKAFDWVREDDQVHQLASALLTMVFAALMFAVWAFVYRKQVDENSDHPGRSGIRAWTNPL